MVFRHVGSSSSVLALPTPDSALNGSCSAGSLVSEASGGGDETIGRRGGEKRWAASCSSSEVAE